MCARVAEYVSFIVMAPSASRVRSAPSSSSSVGIIAGCVSGAVVVVGAILGFVWWKRRGGPPAKSVDAAGDVAMIEIVTKNPIKVTTPGDEKPRSDL